MKGRYKMQKIVKRILAMALVAVFGFINLSTLEVKADKMQSDPDWTKKSAVWQVSEGVTAQIREGVLYIDGNGVVPDYTNDTLDQRPWHTSYYGTVVIGTGITDVGTKAFAENKFLRYFFIPSTTFINDSGLFHKIDSKPVVRIQGTEETVRLIGGKVPYTSLDSLARVAKSADRNVVWITDNGTVKTLFRQKTYPNIPYVYSSDNPDIEDATHLIDNVGEELQVFKSPLRFAPGYEMPGRAVTSCIIKSGVSYLQVVADYLNYLYTDYTYGQTYSNLVSTGDKIFPEFEDTKRYEFQIPVNLQSPGREFKVIMVADGQPSVLDDLDSSDTTITFATNKGSFTYSIIYK